MTSGGRGTWAAGQREGPAWSAVMEPWCNYPDAFEATLLHLSTWCPYIIGRHPGQGDRWVLSLGFFCESDSLTNICDILLPPLTLKRGCPFGGSSLSQKLELIHSHLLALTRLHRRNLFTPEQNSDVLSCKLLPE